MLQRLTYTSSEGIQFAKLSYKYLDKELLHLNFFLLFLPLKLEEQYLRLFFQHCLLLDKSKEMQDKVHLALLGVFS